MWILPKAVKSIPWRLETQLSRVFDATQLGPECDVSRDPAWHELTALVTRLYPQQPSEAEAPIKLHLIDSPQVNAFAALGGEVFILTGLLKSVSGPDALAGVLAHELEHVSQRHMLHQLLDQAAIGTVALALLGDDSAISRLAKSADYWSRLHFTRSQEAEADRGAVRRMRRAGIGLAQLVDLFSSLGQQATAFTWASDHPGVDARIAALRAQPPYPAAPAMPWSHWQAVKALCADAPNAP